MKEAISLKATLCQLPPAPPSLPLQVVPVPWEAPALPISPQLSDLRPCLSQKTGLKLAHMVKADNQLPLPRESI